MGLDDAVDRCHLQVLRALRYLDVTDPTARACVVAALRLRLDEQLDQDARLAISVGARGAQAAIARAMGISPQAVSKRYRDDAPVPEVADGITHRRAEGALRTQSGPGTGDADDEQPAA